MPIVSAVVTEVVGTLTGGLLTKEYGVPARLLSLDELLAVAVEACERDGMPGPTPVPDLILLGEDSPEER